jgi:peptidoglycan/xylan/chitin deacetylase (PgdA/CDA1 family)
MKLLRRMAQIPWRALPAWLAGNRLRILMYHSISDNSGDPHALSPVVFMPHMQSLRDSQVVSLAEGLQRLSAGRSLKNTYVITFDDALLDFYDTALPILQDYTFPVTMFVPTGFAGQTAAWDTYDKTKYLMTWRQMEACQQRQVSFGSHTVNHARLDKCSDTDLATELQLSYQTLNGRLERVTPALAYPGGYQDQRVRYAAKAAGYQYALGTYSRWGNGPETDPYQLRRERLEL